MLCKWRLIVKNPKKIKTSWRFRYV
jgi:hypothetical protein